MSEDIYIIVSNYKDAKKTTLIHEQVVEHATLKNIKHTT